MTEDQIKDEMKRCISDHQDAEATGDFLAADHLWVEYCDLKDQLAKVLLNDSKARWV
jgi:hypothetical protein